jgi:putative ABC transport system permease protein
VIGLILAALRHRRAQALTVLVLTMFAVAAAVASPWYVAGAADKAAAVDLANASQREHLVLVTRSVTTRDPGTAVDPLAQARSTIPDTLAIPGAIHVVGGSQGANVLSAGGGGGTTMPIAFRDGMCEHLKIDGRCPQQPGEALLSRAVASHLELRTGDTISLKPAIGDGQPLTVVGLYDYVDPAGAYWGGSRYVGAVGQGSAGGDPVFVSPGTYGGPALGQITVTDDVRLPDDAFRGKSGANLSDVVAKAEHDLNEEGYTSEFGGQSLANRVAADQDTIRVGVPVGAAQLLALCWFAFFLAGRYAARDRRADIALLKLRGAGTARQLRLTAGQSALPMLGGLLLGGALGFGVARALAGAVRPETQAATLRLSVATALLAMVGGLIAILLAEWTTLRTPVADLLRGVPPRRRGWRTDLVDLLVVAVAVSAAYQAKTQGTGENAGLAPLARFFVALAVALLLARVVGLAMAGLGSSALRSGRLRFALGALQVTRRPGMDRVFALLMVAVAGIVTALTDWSGASAARTTRASQEVGAATVLTVQADNRWQMMAAVRAADPTGTKAMAAVYRGQSGTNSPPVLAVDSTRLASVATWLDGYGADAATLAGQLRSQAPKSLLLHGSSVSVRASADAPDTWLVVRAIQLDTGALQQVALGPLTSTPTDLTGELACSGGTGCRLLSLGLAGKPSAAPGGFLPIPHEVTATITGITQHGPDATVADASALGDVQRWRAGFARKTIVVGASDGALRLVDSEPQTADARVYPIDAPAPLPVVTAGSTARLFTFGDAALSPLGGDTMPIRIAGNTKALPVVGGEGLLVDLTVASQLDSALVGVETQQVWLAPDAPGDIVDKLRAAGLTVTRSTSITGVESRLDDQGPTAALRFALFAALLGLALAATTVAVAAAGETGPRAAELAALRAQGVPARSARAVSYGGYLGLVLAGVLGGLLAAVLSRLFVGTGLPPFVDSWVVLPVSMGLRPYPVLIACLGALLLLGATAAVAAGRLVRATTARTGTPAPPGQAAPPPRKASTLATTGRDGADR